MEREYYPWEDWEEVRYNMWGDYRLCRLVDIEDSIEFMRNTENFRFYMYRVITEWDISCRQNLTHVASNRVAWLGQAAVALKLQAPCDAVRAAWKHLSNQQQRDANRNAAMLIKFWEYNHKKKNTRIH